MKLMNIYNVTFEITVPIAAYNETIARTMMEGFMLKNPMSDQLGFDSGEYLASHVMSMSQIAEGWHGAELFNEKDEDELTPEKIFAKQMLWEAMSDAASDGLERDDVIKMVNDMFEE